MNKAEIIRRCLLAGLSVTAAAGIVIALPEIRHDEGRSLTAYWDKFGQVWTIGDGNTIGVKQGDVITDEQADEMTLSGLIYFGQTTEAALPEVSPRTFAAVLNFHYNIGSTQFLKSQVVRKFRAGDFVGGCRAMLNFKYAGYLTAREQANPRIPKDKTWPTRRNCSIREHGCPGLWDRRVKRMNQCLEGIQQ